MTDSTDDTGYIGSDQPNAYSVITGNKMATARKNSRPKGRRSRATVRPGPVTSVPTDNQETKNAEVKEAHKGAQTIDRREQFMAKRSKMKLRKATSVDNLKGTKENTSRKFSASTEK